MRIAIVTPYTLLNLGLKHLLQKYFDTTPILYNEISEFFDNAPEQFDAYILFADTIIGYSDFFLPRKSKIILLASLIRKDLHIKKHEIRDLLISRSSLFSQ